MASESVHGESTLNLRNDYLESPAPLAATVSGAGDEWRKRHIYIRKHIVVYDSAGHLRTVYMPSSEPVDEGLPMITGGGSLTLYKILEVFPNHLRCQAYDPIADSLSGTNVLVAKQPDARQSHTHEAVDGISYVFSYIDDNHRTASVVGSSTTNTQYDRLYKPYVTGSSYGEDWVWASPATTGVVVDSIPVPNIEVKPSRIWARKSVQS